MVNSKKQLNKKNYEIEELIELASSTSHNDALATEIAAKKALELSEEYDYKRGKIYALFYLGESLYRQGKLFDAINHMQIALNITDPNKDIIPRSMIWTVLGNVHLYLKVYDLAFYYYNLAIDACEEGKRIEALAMLYNNVGEIYRELGDFEKALRSYESCKNICIENNFERVLMYATANIGVTYYEINDFDKALKNLLESYNKSKITNNFIIEYFASRYLGLTYEKLNDLAKTEQFFKESLAVCDKSNEAVSKAEILKDFGSFYLKSGRTEEALLNLNQAYEIAKELQAYQLIIEIVDLFQVVYEEVGDYNKAYEYNKMRFEVREKRELQEKEQRLRSINIQISVRNVIKENESIRILNKKLKDKTKSLAKATKELKRINKELQALNGIDGLTEIANRKKLDNYCNEVIKLNSKRNGKVTMMAIDIDGFKEYNDYYGHLIGDEALKELARILKDSIINIEGLAARYGGDEFVLVLPKSDLTTAQKIAQKIQLDLSDRRIVHEKSPISKYLTVSIGIAEIEAILDIEFKTIMNLADKALYKAKQTGKNKIVFDTL